ncbi:MAG: hypothetical protein HYT07_04105 [Candidatus Levybacteria bacterium]|nr:hypothetical protein [Candidatus Levybacteria bacterium]
MRNDYVKVIKDYIAQKPEYKFTLNELKNDVVSAGATEEEFEEAVKQATGYHPSMLQQSLNNLQEPLAQKQYKATSLISKIIHSISLRERLLIYLFASILLFVSSLINVFGSYTRMKPQENLVSIPTPTLVQHPLNIVREVYANLRPIDPSRAFSTPKSNVPLAVNSKPKKEVFGFLPYWMLPKGGEIDLSLLTSVSIFGLEVDGEGNIVTVGSTNEVDKGWEMWKDPTLDQFIGRARDKNIKIFLTIKAFSNNNIEKLVLSDDAQKALIANSLYLFSSKNLNGINLDFEYVGKPGENIRDGFTRLVTNLNAELKRQYPKSQLTLDTYIREGNVPGLFDLKLLEAQVDAFVVMGYDFNTPDGTAGPIAPMGGEINMVGSMQGYLEKVPADKLILAVPYYGYGWPTKDAGDVAILPYSVIIAESKKHTTIWNETWQTPSFTYVDNGVERTAHFDNVRSMGIKFDYVNAKNLKGIGIWALGYDGYNSDLQRLIIDKFAN